MPGSVCLVNRLSFIDSLHVTRAYVTLQKRTHNIPRDAQQFGGPHLVRIAMQVGILHKTAFYIVEQTVPRCPEAF
jgi:hypothetical protein